MHLHMVQPEIATSTLIHISLLEFPLTFEGPESGIHVGAFSGIILLTCESQFQ